MKTQIILVLAVSFISILASAKEPTMLSCVIDKELVAESKSIKVLQKKDTFTVQFSNLQSETPLFKSGGTLGLLGRQEHKLMLISHAGDESMSSTWYAVDAGQMSASVIQLVHENKKRVVYLHRLFSRTVENAANFPDNLTSGDCK